MTPMDFKGQEASTMLAGLPIHEPSLQCSERIRGRCHAVLHAKRKRAEAPPEAARSVRWRHVLESAAVAVLCAGYLSEVVGRAIALFGF